MDGVLDTVENRTYLPSALVQTLQRLSVHRTTQESSLVMGIGGTWLVRGGGIQGGMTSPGSLPVWGSSGSKSGEG